MLNFIVLGIIPGTHSQITFYQLLAAIASLCFVILLIVFMRRLLQHAKEQMELFAFQFLSTQPKFFRQRRAHGR